MEALKCPKCKVELQEMPTFGRKADLYLCPKCELAFSRESLEAYDREPIRVWRPAYAFARP